MLSDDDIKVLKAVGELYVEDDNEEMIHIVYKKG